MQFSIYSELQSWPGKSQKQVYDEALAQCVNADRLGYDAYAIIEHFFFSKFGASPNPFAFLAKARGTLEPNFRLPFDTSVTRRFLRRGKKKE